VARGKKRLDFGGDPDVLEPDPEFLNPDNDPDGGFFDAISIGVASSKE